MEVNSNKNVFIKEFISKNNNSFVAPYVALRFLSNSSELDELKQVVSLFSGEVTISNYVQQLNYRIEILEKTSIGQIVPDFSLPDTTGNNFSLNNLIRKLCTHRFLNFLVWSIPSRKSKCC